MTVKYFPFSVRARILDVIGKKGPADRETGETPPLSCPPYFPLFWLLLSQFGSLCFCFVVAAVLNVFQNNFDSFFFFFFFLVSWRSLCVCCVFFALRAHRPRFCLMSTCVSQDPPSYPCSLSLSKWSLISFGILKKKNPRTKSRESVFFFFFQGLGGSFFGSSISMGALGRQVLFFFSVLFCFLLFRGAWEIKCLPLCSRSLLPPSFAFFFF